MRYLMLLVVISIIPSYAQKQINDLEKLKLSGNIRTIEQRGFKAIEKFGEVISESSIIDIHDSNSLIQFDANGNIISINLLDLEGNIGGKIYYTYLNQIQKIPVQGHKLEGELKYDGNQNVSEIIYYNEDGTLDFKIINKFDKSNNLIEKKIYEAQGVLNAITKHKFDNFGNIIEIKEFMPSTNTTRTESIKYEFDIHNNWIKKIRTYEGKLYAVIERKISYF